MSEEIVAAGRFLYERGWSPATSSNYSARIDGEYLAITASGKHKGRLALTDVLVVDLEGTPLHSHRRASAETLLHSTLYAHRPDIGAVLHTHSLNATLLSRMIPAGECLELHDYELLKAFEGVEQHDICLRVPVFDNTQDIRALSETAWSWLSQHPECPGYLIRGHGLYTWAESMSSCLRHVEAFEFLLACDLEERRFGRTTRNV